GAGIYMAPGTTQAAQMVSNVHDVLDVAGGAETRTTILHRDGTVEQGDITAPGPHTQPPSEFMLRPWPARQGLLPLTDVTAIAAGFNLTLALRSDGTVWYVSSMQ